MTDATCQVKVGSGASIHSPWPVCGRAAKDKLDDGTLACGPHIAAAKRLAAARAERAVFEARKQAVSALLKISVSGAFDRQGTVTVSLVSLERLARGLQGGEADG